MRRCGQDSKDDCKARSWAGVFACWSWKPKQRRVTQEQIGGLDLVEYKARASAVNGHDRGSSQL